MDYVDAQLMPSWCRYTMQRVGLSSGTTKTAIKQIYLRSTCRLARQHIDFIPIVWLWPRTLTFLCLVQSHPTLRWYEAKTLHPAINDFIDNEGRAKGARKYSTIRRKLIHPRALGRGSIIFYYFEYTRSKSRLAVRIPYAWGHLQSLPEIMLLL